MNPISYSFILLVKLSLIILLATNCQADHKSEKVSEIEPVSFLALGDSYTIGTGIEGLYNWPNQLKDSLQSRGYEVDTLQIIATNGWTTTDLKNGLSKIQPNSFFNLVSVLIGVNNQYQGLELDLYGQEFRELLDEAIALAGMDTSNVFVVSIPNYGVTPFGEARNPVIIRQELETYNKIAENIASEYDVPFVNITAISELAADDHSLLAPDDLHPSTKMYALWVEEMMSTVIQMLKNHE